MKHPIIRMFLMLVAVGASAVIGPLRADEPGASVNASASASADVEVGADDTLSLSDLSAYRAALSGKATADDARPARVGFRDIWGRPAAYRGRLVTVRGQVQRTFRQGPIGSFPPLVQVWIFSTAGDPFCLVFPNPTDEAWSRRGAGAGQPVEFTGTFLKMVRYAAGDGSRLAPLIVGARPPAPAARSDTGTGTDTAGEVFRALGGQGQSISSPDRWVWSWTSWGLGLALAVVAAVVLASRHRRAARPHRRSASADPLLDASAADPPLRFLDTPEGPRV